MGLVAAPARDITGDEITLDAAIVPSIPPEYRLLANYLHETSALPGTDVGVIPSLLAQPVSMLNGF